MILLLTYYDHWYQYCLLLQCTVIVQNSATAIKKTGTPGSKRSKNREPPLLNPILNRTSETYRCCHSMPSHKHSYCQNLDTQL